MKLDDFFMLLAKLIGIILAIIILYYVGAFDLMLGQTKFFIDYQTK